MEEKQIKEEVTPPQTTENFSIKKKKPWLMIALITLIVIIFGAISVLAYQNYLLKDQIQTKSIVQNKVIKYDPKDKAFFYRNGSQINNRAGIWDYDFSQKTETQLISFQEMLGTYNTSPNDLYANPEISPDLTKIVFYLKSSGDNYNLWLYDLTSGKKQKILEDIVLFKGYIQSPRWSKNSDLIYITLYENGLNRLSSIDLHGNKKRLANSYVVKSFGQKLLMILY